MASTTPTTPRNVNSKRQDYLEWSEYYIANAFLAAKRSKDPCSQVGACIVNKENKIVGIGYNGMPKGCSDDIFPWKNESEHELENKYLYVCHAEVNAILNKNSDDVRDCTIYVGLFPCFECAKVIIQSGIKEVVFMSDEYPDKTSVGTTKLVFDEAGVVYKQFVPKNKTITIDFEKIDWDSQNQMPPTP